MLMVDVQRLIKSHLGNKLSEETKRKMSLTNGGTGMPHEHSDYGDKFTLVLRESIRKG